MTDTVPGTAAAVDGKGPFEVLSVAPLLAYLLRPPSTPFAAQLRAMQGMLARLEAGGGGGGGGPKNNN